MKLRHLNSTMIKLVIIRINENLAFCLIRVAIVEFMTPLLGYSVDEFDSYLCFICRLSKFLLSCLILDSIIELKADQRLFL